MREAHVRANDRELGEEVEQEDFPAGKIVAQAKIECPQRSLPNSLHVRTVPLRQPTRDLTPNVGREARYNVPSRDVADSKIVAMGKEYGCDQLNA
jgi:hypothetical protein